MRSKTGSLGMGLFRHSRRLTTATRAAFRILPCALCVVLIGGATPPQNLGEALQAQRSLVAENPRNVDHLNDLGNLLALAGDLEGAEEAYRRALEIDPGSSTVQYNLALVLQEQGDTKQARKALQSLLESDPDHAWGHYQLGNLYAAKKNRKMALEHYERAFTLDRSLASPKVNPHIVENRLVTAALLQMYVAQAPSTQAPRVYREPGNVADLLLPSSPPPEASSNESALEDVSAATTPEARQYRSTYPPRAGVSQGWDSAPDDSQTATETLGDESATSTTGTRSSTAPTPTWSGVTGTAPGGLSQGGTLQSQEPSSPAPGAPPPVRRITVDDLPPSSNPAGSSSPFTPGTQSTGRLDIELVPDPRASRTAVAS
jgi:hypothetical protein